MQWRPALPLPPVNTIRFPPEGMMIETGSEGSRKEMWVERKAVKGKKVIYITVPTASIQAIL